MRIKQNEKDRLIAELKDEISRQKREIAMLKGVQQAMPDPYYIRDMDYNVIFWPEEIQKLTGYSQEDAKKLNVMICLKRMCVWIVQHKSVFTKVNFYEMPRSMCFIKMEIV